MDWSLASFLSELRLSLQSPREGIRRIIALDPPMAARWIGLWLVAIGGTVLMVASFRLGPAEDLPPGLRWAIDAPIALSLVQALSLLMLALALYWMGRFRGGRGSFADSLSVLVWFQIIMLFVQIAQILVLIVLPPLADVALLAGMVLFFWLLTNFIAELHGFSSLWLTFAGLLAGLAALFVALAIILVLIIALTVGVPPA